MTSGSLAFLRALQMEGVGLLFPDLMPGLLMLFLQRLRPVGLCPLSWFFAEVLGDGQSPSLDGSFPLDSPQSLCYCSPHEGEVLQEAR